MSVSFQIQVAAGVVFHGSRVLIARRPHDDSLAGYWEFPGGKIETGETPEQCLEREFDEEFGMRLSVGGFLKRTEFPYRGGRGELLAYRAQALSLPRVLTAHDAALWVVPQNLAAFNLSPADLPVAATLLSTLSNP